MIRYKSIVITGLALLLCTVITTAQETRINWLSFEELEDSLAVEPRKVYIDFYADWCAYCKKMNQAAYRDSEVIDKLNTAYYAVKMNAEATDTITFGGTTFINKQLGKKRNPNHEIPLLLASRDNRPFSLPALIVLNENFEITGRYFEYLSPQKLQKVLVGSL